MSCHLRSRSYAFLVAVVQRVTCWMCLGGVDRSCDERFFVWFSFHLQKVPMLLMLVFPTIIHFDRVVNYI